MAMTATTTTTAMAVTEFLDAFSVAPGVWLGRYHPHGNRSLPPHDRRIADRRAAGLALEAALGFAGLDQDSAGSSLSHSEGVGAALIGPRHCGLGVDVVRIGRVTRRHTEAVLTPREAGILLGPDHLWAIKEAASKATGDALAYFPSGIQIVNSHADQLRIRTTRGPLRTYSAEWREIDEFLYAWVVEDERDPA